MQDTVELERRITAALDRIGQGIEALGPAAAPAADAPAAPAGPDLAQALDDERMANAQLTERLKAAREREAQAVAEAHAAGRAEAEAEARGRIDRMTRQLDVQALEMQRMRKTVVQLRETLRALHEAAAAGLSDPSLVNRALLAEADALRAARQGELALMDEILEELAPLIPETREDA
jgi:flagellar biosynthesis/type III secretory pathway protein FliH